MDVSHLFAALAFAFVGGVMIGGVVVRYRAERYWKERNLGSLRMAGDLVRKREAEIVALREALDIASRNDRRGLDGRFVKAD